MYVEASQAMSLYETRKEKLALFFQVEHSNAFHLLFAQEQHQYPGLKQKSTTFFL